MRALKPSLATTQGPLLLTSSPGIEEGVTYRIWERHYGAKGDARTVVVHSDSLGLNPTLAKAVVDRAFEEDATSAEAEYGGRFRSPISNYLERSLVMQAVQPGLTLKAVLPGIRYFGHVDVAGGNGKDSFAAAVGHVVMDPGGRPVVCFDALFEIRPKFDPDDAVRRCTELMKLYGITTVYADGYAGNWPITGFAKYGVSYQICPLSASEIYLHSLPSWTASRVRALDNQRSIDQLAALRRKPTQSGRESIDHPRGGHDDLALVISGVIWQCTPVQRQQQIPRGGWGVFVGPRTGFPGSVDSGAARENMDAYLYASGQRR